MPSQPLVLLVADDGQTRRAIGQGLESYGHQVLATADGHQALQAMSAHRGRIGVVVTDVDMRGEVDGLAVATMARTLDPRVCVIYTARRPYSIPASRQVSGAPLVRTPYHPHQLAGVIAMLRHEPRAHSGAELEGTHG